MPQYQIELPGQGKFTVDSPTELSDAQVYAAIQAQLSQQKTGILAAGAKGVESTLSQLRSGLGGLFGAPEEAATAGIARGKQISSEYADQVSLEKLKQAYEQGLLPAVGEVARQIPLALAEQGANLATMAGGARLGAMAGAPFGPAGAVIGGGIGAVAPSLIQQFGGNIERQAQLQEEANQPVAIDRTKALTAAVPQAALDVASSYIPLGGRLVSKLTGIPEKALLGDATGKAAKLAEERLLATLGKGTAVGVAAEVPTEITQQILERWQAGLSLTDADALKEYGETAYQTALLGPLGAVGRLSERAGARMEVSQQQALEKRKLALEQMQLDEQERQKQEAAEAYKQTPKYAQVAQTKYTALKQQMADLSAKAAAKVDPNDALAVAEQANAKQQLAALKKSDEFKTAEAEFKRVVPLLREQQARAKAEEEQKALAELEPAEAFLRREGYAQAPISPEEEAQTRLDTLLGRTFTPPPAKASALDQYAEQQIQLANERELADALTPEEQQTVYAKYLLTDPTYLRALVQSRASLPGLSGKLSEKIRDQLKLALKGLGQEVGETREARSAEQAAAAAKLQQEREALERMRQAPEYLKGMAQERVESLETDKRIKQLQEQLYTPVQAQRELFGAEPTGAPTLGETLEQARQRLAQNGMALDAAVMGQYGKAPAVAGEAPGSVTRTIAKEPDEQTVKTLLERLRSAPNVDEKTRTLAAQVQDRLPQVISAFASQTEEAAARTPQRGITTPAAKEQAPVNQAGQIAEWAYKALTGTPPPELTASLQNALRDIEAAGRSETEAVTQVGRRRFTPEEKQGLQGTAFGERAQTSLLEGETATTLANFVQNTPKDTPVNKATGELLYALQNELPFTDRRGEPVARTTSAAFNSWEEFQKYLASEGLQALRSAQADVLGNVTLLKKTAPGEPVSRTTLEALSPANPRLQSSAGTYTFTPQETVTVKRGAFPNIHRAAMLVNRLNTAAQKIRDQVQGITDARNAFTAQARGDAQASRQIREEAEKALAKLLSTDVWEMIGSGEAAETKYAGKWDTELLDKVQKAKAKLDSAQRVRDQLMAQLQSHIAAFMRRVEEYERATEPVVAYPAEGAVGPYAESVAKTQPATVMLQYEAQGEKRREAAKKAAMTARNTLSETVKDLIEVQRLVPMAQKAVNFIDDTTPLAEAAFRRKKLQEHLAEEKRLQALVSKQYTQFVSLIEQSRAGVEKPFIKTGEFEKFLVEEARLTELINQQNKSLGGFKLAVSNAKNKLNAAYTQAETSADQNQLLGLRQAVLEATALEKEMLTALTGVQKIADTPELLQQQEALKTRAYEVAERAKRGKSAAKRLAEASSTKPRAEETQADREARSAEKRQEEQKFLEYVQGTTESVPREQILMEARRKILQEIQDKVDKLTPLREIAESPDSTLDERVEAANEFARLYKETTGALERRDERIRKAMERETTLLKQLEETREILAKPIELSARAQKQFKNDPDKLEELKAVKKAALEDRVKKLLAAFNKNAKFLSDNRGVDRVKIPQTKKATADAREKLTKLRNDPEFINRYTSEDETTRQEAREELQESVRNAYPENWREVEENISTAVERIAQTQTTERKKGPLTKKGTVAPAQLLTGTEESRKGETRTSTVNKLREPGDYADALINKVIKTRGELDAVLSRLKFIKDHPAPTKEGKEKQKAAKDRLTEEKTRLEAVMRELRAEQAPIAKELAEEKPSTAKPKKESAAEKKARELREIGEEGDIELSRGTTENPSTIDSVRTELKKTFPDLGRVQLYDSVDALIKANPQYEGKIPSDARGFVDTAGNKAFLIAENIEQGQALSVLLHEVGTHIGLKNMLGDAQYNSLVNAVKSWEKKADGSIEARVAKAARARVEAAETKPSQVNDELLAYAVEEAVNAGVKPTETKGVLGRWLSQIAALFRRALERFGMAPEKLDAQGLVDLAFGAAQIEMAPKVPQMSRRQFLRGAGAALGAMKLPPLSKEMNLRALRSVFEGSLDARGAWFDALKTAAKTKGLGKVIDQYEDLYEGDNALVAFTQSDALQSFLYNTTYNENYQGDGYDYYLNELLSGKDGIKIVADLQQALRAQAAGLVEAAQKLAKDKGLPEVGDLFFTYAGEKSGVAPDALRKAKDLQIKGAEMEKIWNETGWFQGPDKKWRYEIDDSQAKFSISDLTNKYAPGIGDKHKTTVGALMDHPELYALYPDIKNIKVTLYNDPNSDSLGSFDRTKKQIELNVGTSYDPELVLLHELQHYIQGEEGFTRGGSTTGEYLEGYTKAILNAVRESYVRQAEENAGEKYYADKVKALDAGIAAAQAAKSKRAAELRAARAEWQKTSSAIEAELESLKNEVKSKQDAIDAARDAYFAASDAYLDLLKRRSRPDQSVIDAAKEKSDQARDALDKASAAEIPYEDYRKQSDALRDQKRKALKDWLNVRYAGKVNIEAAVNDAIKSQLPKSSFFGKFARLMISEQAYQNLLGEIEARDVEERRKLTAEERAVTRPYSSQPQRREEVLFSRAPKYKSAELSAAGEVADKVIASEKPLIQRLRSENTGLAFATAYVDRFAGFEKLAKYMPHLEGTQMLYFLRMYDQRMNFVAQAANNGALQVVKKKRPDGREERLIESVEGASLRGMAETLAEAKDLVGDKDGVTRLFTLYLSAFRVKDKGLAALNFGDKLTQADLDKAVRAVESTPGLEEIFKRARKEYNDYNKGLLNFLVQTDAMPKDVADRLLKNDDYIPWYREVKGHVVLDIGSETPFRIGNLADQPYLHELIGGNKPILDISVSAVQNTNMLVDMGLRNLATKNAIFELVDLKLATISRKQITGTDVVSFRIRPEDAKDTGERWARIDTDSKDVPADLLVKGMEGIPTQLTGIMRLMQMPATLLRKAIVLSPLYQARQIFRDSLAAPILAGADFTPVVGALKEINSATSKVLENRGITGGQVFTGTNEDVSRILQDIVGGKPGWMKLVGKLEAMGMEADAATRRAQYNSYIEQGLSEMEATLMSLESMNFNKRGASPSIHALNSLIPFFNAQIQSLNVLYKAMTGKMPFNEKLRIQQKLLERGFMLAAVSAYYAMAMQDDEAYKNARPEQKYGNWFMRLPGVEEPIKLPIPFEIGYIFKALPEAMVNLVMDKHASDDIGKALATIILQTIPGGSSYGLPQAMKPLVEYATGHSFFTQRDILSQHEKALLPEAQYRDNTSELAKSVGKAFGVSPIMTEQLINGYFGTMGLVFVQAISLGITPSEGPAKAMKRLSDMPVIGGAFQPNDAGNIISSTYDRMLEVKQLKTTVDDLIKRGQKAEAKALLEKRGQEYMAAEAADFYISTIRQLTQMENAVRASNQTAEEKRKTLDALREKKTTFATTFREAYDKRTRQSARP